MAGDFYDMNIPLIEGGSQELSLYHNKRVMVITLPIQQSMAADSLLTALDSLAYEYRDSLSIIAVPAIVDGNWTAQRSSIQIWYRSKLNARIVITDGLYTEKSSGVQHDLFKWLTSSVHNGTFDNGADRAGYKFFISKAGRLYAVLSPETPLSARATAKMINAQ